MKRLSPIFKSGVIQVQKINSMHDYIWAVNKVKLSRAFSQLSDEKKLNASVVIDEESIKARYIKLAGLVRESGSSAPEPKSKPKSKKEAAE